MNEAEAMRLFKAMLENEGAEWTEESGWLRFRSKHDGMLWETACRPTEGAMLLYGRFPFSPQDPAQAKRVCEEANRKLVRGALFLTEEGCPVYRCRAELDDVYGAEGRLEAALRYSAQVITHYWGRLAGT